jgi:hypothetical protein
MKTGLPFLHPHRRERVPEAWRKRARTTTRISCAVIVAYALLGRSPALDASPDGCIAGYWIAQAVSFVEGETGHPVPRVCIRWASPETVNRLILPPVPNESHAGAVAAAYLPAKGEIVLASDLDPGTPLARSYLVHELVHAQQFEARAHEQASCPGALEGAAYEVQARYLRAKGLEDDAFLFQVLGMLQRACGSS